MTKLRLDAGSLVVEPFALSSAPAPAIAFLDGGWSTDDGPLAATSTCQGAASCEVTCACGFDPLDA